MGQVNLIRSLYDACEEITSSQDDDIQNVACTAMFKVGDTVDIVDRDAQGCDISTLGTRTVTGICPNTAIVFDTDIDTSAATGTPYACNRSLDDGQAALDRIFDCYGNSAKYPVELCTDISAQALNTPVAGDTEYIVDDVGCFAAGDTVAVICDEGLFGNSTVNSVDVALNKLVIDDLIDTTAGTNCKICNTSLTLDQALRRLKASTQGGHGDENLGQGDCDQTVWYAGTAYNQNTSKWYLDGRKLYRGTCGTQATLVNDAVDAEITFTSLVLGTKGNDIEIEMLDPGGTTPLSIAVTGDFDTGDRKVSITLETVAAAIVSTAEEVVDAINADAVANLLIGATFGGDGTGVQSALTAIALSGGLNDGTGDYCEMELHVDGASTGTTFRIVSLWILPTEKNRLNRPPRDSEDLNLEYLTP